MISPIETYKPQVVYCDIFDQIELAHRASAVGLTIPLYLQAVVGVEQWNSRHPDDLLFDGVPRLVPTAKTIDAIAPEIHIPKLRCGVGEYTLDMRLTKDAINELYNLADQRQLNLAQYLMGAVGVDMWNIQVGSRAKVTTSIGGKIMEVVLHSSNTVPGT